MSTDLHEIRWKVAESRGFFDNVNLLINEFKLLM